MNYIMDEKFNKIKKEGKENSKYLKIKKKGGKKKKCC